jgi:hypothetical protein
MAINENLLNSNILREKVLRRPSDRALFLAAAILFPLLVLIGYFKTYYFSAFFSDARPMANALVHAHAVVMSLWVLYFAAQIALVRTKNIKLHMTMGMVGIALAVLVVVVGMVTAYDSHIVRHTAPPGIDPYSFAVVPIFGMTLFIIYFTGAIYYRKRPAEHKTLMLLTAFNFLPAALVRIPPIGENVGILGAFAAADLLAVICLILFTIKHRKFNKVFGLGVLLLIVSHPLQLYVGMTESWVRFIGWAVS